jgi:hypothetical protein
MKHTTVTINGHDLTAHYEYVEAEEGDYDYPGTQPSIILWGVLDTNFEVITHTLTKDQYQSVEDQIYTHEEL